MNVYELRMMWPVNDGTSDTDAIREAQTDLARIAEERGLTMHRGHYRISHDAIGTDRAVTYEGRVSTEEYQPALPLDTPSNPLVAQIHLAAVTWNHPGQCFVLDQTGIHISVHSEDELDAQVEADDRREAGVCTVVQLPVSGVAS